MDVENYLNELFDVFLNRANYCLGEANHYKGTPTGEHFRHDASIFAQCADEVGCRLRPKKRLVGMPNSSETFVFLAKTEE